MPRWTRLALLSLLTMLLAAAAGMGWWLNRPLDLATTPLELVIEPGTLPRGVADAAVAAGVRTRSEWLYQWFRWSGQARDIKAGNYEIEAGTTPVSLLRKLARGEESLQAVTLVEGWSLRQVRAALRREPHLKPDTQALDDAQLMAALGRPGRAAEGRFFPDTYTYGKGASDLAVLKRAMHAMDRELARAWERRDPRSVLRSAEEALILASIVEKETGKPADRTLISGVFHNRLRIGMPLQTDPTVIYGMGERFDGNLRRRDLQTDTPWNTYTRNGLPPTPIAMPGRAALLAAVQPAESKALYFVARGDGSSHFSETLDEHNRAVDRYQRAPARQRAAEAAQGGGS
ncbi:MAG: endolytic transglycosylase MltG [Burkholderiaceae bacterium]